MKTPIIINDSQNPDRSGDLGVYDSVEAAERACEPWVADYPAIRAFDSQGWLLAATPAWQEGCVRWRPATETPEHLKVLTVLLRDYLRVTGTAPEAVEIMSVDDMLTAIHQNDPNPGSWTPAPRKPRGAGGLIARLKALFAS